MSVSQRERATYLPMWRRLVDAARSAASDPSRPAVKELKDDARDARRLWTLPTEDERGDGVIFVALTGMATAYAGQTSATRRNALASSILWWCVAASAILDRLEPPSPAVMRPFRADIDG